jgi:phage terminase large subunit-like protein
LKFTAKQELAQAILAGIATYLMLFGGSRSGKTFLLVRNVVMRALKAPKSRHAILRFRFNAVKASVIYDTFPKVMEVAFPGVTYTLNKTDWFAELPNGSQVWFGGLDDKERTEKILGQEYATIYLNESSQIPWASVGVAITRLAQAVMESVKGAAPKLLKPRLYADCNPPSKAHWTYKLFVLKVDPETGEPLKKPEDYAYFQINPEDNAENVAPGYLETLRGLSNRLQKRFLRGEFADATPNQLFSEETIEKHRFDGQVPDLIRIVVAVDPSGSGDTDNADNDEIGIVVAGLGVDGCGYVLEDCTVKAGPATWGRIATTAFDRHQADVVVGETNFGGAMVQHVVQTARARTPYKAVTASRGKAVRAEPISALYEQGKVRHVGIFRELENEMTAFSTIGYMGEGSPNRADALVWAMTELFPGMTKPAKKKAVEAIPMVNHW